MKIVELHQRAFGHFTDHALTFGLAGGPSGAGGLHVIFGANEAGKTTTLHAIRYGLYGIPDLRSDPRTYDFLHRKPDLRIAMVVESAAGERLAFTRRKKTGESCFDFADTAPAPETQRQLDALLRGVDRDLFTRRYGIDHQTLREGGEGLAGNNDTLGESLFAASTGIVEVSRTLKELAAQADRLLKGTGRSGLIADALKAFKEAEGAVRHARAAGNKWHPKQNEIAACRTELEQLRQRIAAHEAELARSEAIQSALGHMVERAQALESIEELGPVIESWSAEREQERLTLRKELFDAERDSATVRGELDERLRREQDLSRGMDERVLAAADRIALLTERIGEYLSARNRAGELEAAQGRAITALRGACRAVSPATDTPDDDSMVSAARKLIPVRAARTAADELLADYRELRGSLFGTERDLRLADEALAKFSAEMPADPQTGGDVDALRAAVRGIEKVDTARLSQIEQRIASQEQQLADSARALPRCAHEVDALLALPVPLDATVEEFAGRLRDARSDADRERAALDDARAGLLERDEDIKRLSRDRGATTPEALTEARSDRDELWMRIRASWLGEVAPVEPGPLAPGLEAANAYEISVRESDRQADQLVDAGELAGQLAAAQAARAELEAEIGRRETALEGLEAELRHAEGEWEAIWQQIRVQPGTIAEMRSWLEGLRTIRTASESLRSERDEAESLRKRVKRARRDLSAALAAAGAEPAAEDTSVEVLEARANAIVDAADLAREAAVQREAEHRHLVADRNHCQGQLQSAEQAIAVWSERWAQVAPQIGLPAGSPPEAGPGALEAIDSVERALHELESASGTSANNQRTIAGFEQDLHELLDLIDPELATTLHPLPADQAVRQIAKTADASQRALTALEEVRPQIEKDRARLQSLERNLETANSGLQRLAASAGVGGIDALDTAAERWKVREEHRRQVTDAGHAITQLTKMEPAAATAFLETTGADELPELIAAQQQQLEELQQLRDVAEEDLGKRQQELGELGTQAQLVQALADRDDARARIETLSSDYARVKLEHDFLASFLRERATAHIGPALIQAGELLAQLTAREYAGLTQDVASDDTPVLKVIPADGPGLDRTGLSTGTGDQLYLALRLASIYQQLNQPGQEPIPFIVDDILMTFDDARSAATMRVLADLATRTQVIFFTHHQHLVDLARREVPNEILQVTMGLQT